MSKKIFLLFLLFVIACATYGANNYPDLLNVFKNAHEGQPLRCVAIGGSITQAGECWIGPWLRETFPKSTINTHNAGMSATGSMLGMFRLDRDVISCQPDLVLIEFAVNDGGVSDESACWTLESIVRRLKTLDHPPAIVFLLAASKNKTKVYRHEKIANHYGLKIVNLQTATDDYLKSKNSPWEELFGDNVHPNSTGHDFYAKAIAEELAPIAKRAATLNTSPPIPPLPKQLSKNRLVLDGRMVPIAVYPGWTQENQLPFWWNKFFMGVTSSKTPGATMRVSFRGTIAGLFYALDKTYGMFYANIDGDGFKEIICNNRKGYSYSILGRQLTPETHILNLALPQNSHQGQGVKLGFLLLGGETGAKETLAKQGSMSAERLSQLKFEPLTENWHWIGPFGDIRNSWSDNKKLETVYPPEKKLIEVDSKSIYTTSAGEKVNWQKINARKIDFSRLTNYDDRGICYASAQIKCDQAEEKSLAFRVDYWGKIWINGVLALTVDQGHGSPQAPIYFKAKFKKGWNTIMVKVHSGSKGNYFSLEVQK